MAAFNSLDFWIRTPLTCADSATIVSGHAFVSRPKGCIVRADGIWTRHSTIKGTCPLDLDLLDLAIAERAEAAFSFLERLVAAPSTVGREQPAQEIVEHELDRLGFLVDRLSIPEGIGDDPLAGVPQASYDGRYDVIGHHGDGAGPSLLVNGHIDVVPAEQPERWASLPFEPRRHSGKLYGRGSGDMKGGFAMATLAIDSLMATAPDAISGSLTFASVIEEECTGNGTLAAARAGVLADAVILPEPTGLSLLLAGVGIDWLDVEIAGRSTHAESADRAVNPVDLALLVVSALRDLEHEMNADIEPSMDGVKHPYNINIGTFAAGDWPSSVPAVATIRVRVGHPTSWTPDQTEERVRAAIDAIDEPWLREHPPSVTPSGFKAKGYALPIDHPLVDRVARAHQAAHGARPLAQPMASTTDARLYLNDFDVPALCYGPTAHDIHGIDESVELDSIVDGAKTLARFINDWFADPAGGR
jgi:acetylornithine deacetylase